MPGPGATVAVVNPLIACIVREFNTHMGSTYIYLRALPNIV